RQAESGAHTGLAPTCSGFQALHESEGSKHKGRRGEGEVDQEEYVKRYTGDAHGPAKGRQRDCGNGQQVGEGWLAQQLSQKDLRWTERRDPLKIERTVDHLISDRRV